MSDESTREVTGWSGHRRMTVDEIAAVAASGLGTIMPRISRRYWILYYAAQQGNWPLARFQTHEIHELMELGAYTRPKYEKELEEFLLQRLKPLEAAIEKQDWAAFEEAYREGIKAANSYHEARDKGFIVWHLPDYPPPELDLTPKGK